METWHEHPAAELPEGLKMSYETPADVDDFFERNTGVFQAIDSFWGEARTARAAFDDIIRRPLMPLPPERQPDGSMLGTFVWLKGGRSESRSAVASAVRDLQRMGEGLRAIAGHDVMTMDDLIADMVTTKAIYSQPAACAVINGFNASIEEGKKDLSDGLPRAVKKLRVVMPPEITETSNAMQSAYRRAYLAQAFGLQRVALFMADDAQVRPFVDRVAELALLARHGAQEFPGFLETIATHVAHKRTGSAFMNAFERTTYSQWSKEAFVDALLQENAGGVKLPKHLMPSLAAVVVVAQAVRQELGDGRIGQGDIVRAIAAHFDSLPTEWQEAYAAHRRAQVTALHDQFAEVLEPFVRRGRMLPSGAATLEEFDDAHKMPGRKRSIRGPRTNGSAHADEDKSSIEREAAPLAAFAVMKRSEGSSKVITIERQATIDELMRHDVVANFLDTHRGEPNLAARLRNFIEQLAEQPFDPANTMVLRDRGFSLNDPGANSAIKYSRRRFRPRRTTGDEGAKGMLLSRLRISYAVAVVDGEQCLLIDEVALRDESSFRN